MVANINDRKRVKEAVRRSEAYLCKIFETLPDALAIVDRNYRYQRVNSAYEGRTGLRPEQIIGMHVADINGVEVFTARVDIILRAELDYSIPRIVGDKVHNRWFLI